MQAPEGDFRFTQLENVVYGPGKLTSIGRELDRRELKRALIVTGKTLGASPLIERVKGALGERLAGVFTGIRQHVPSKTVAAAVEEAKRVRADCMVSFGGGSPIDAAKLVAMAIMTGDAAPHPINFRQAKTVVVGPELPNFAIPTTLSAGEFTGGAGMTDETTRHKGGRFDDRLVPLAVILDPALTLQTPDWLWASTGIKALDHALECAYSSRRQLICDTLATRAIKVLRTHLLPSFKGLGHEQVAHRGMCQLGAWMSIFGMLNTRLGISHALGHQIGARWDVPHGVTSCITVPHVMRFMAQAAPQRFEAIAEGFEVAFDPANPRPAALQCAERAAEYIRGLGVPTRLSDAGVPRSELGQIIEPVLAEINGARTLENPVTAQEMTALLEAAY
ncbi:MAG TPA: iron-containing alcohol dehydrogenase [Candidatus Binataceae bacterium]|nr:iron-containing alcohol dehydrogenase [Candidatus Binataceae bacterium]